MTDDKSAESHTFHRPHQAASHFQVAPAHSVTCWTICTDLIVVSGFLLGLLLLAAQRLKVWRVPFGLWNIFRFLIFQVWNSGLKLNVRDWRDSRLLRFESEAGEDGIVATQVAAQLLLAENKLTKKVFVWWEKKPKTWKHHILSQWGRGGWCQLTWQGCGPWIFLMMVVIENAYDYNGEDIGYEELFWK